MTWHERIDAAEKRGVFTGDDNERASEWVDCACGEQDPRIPRYEQTTHIEWEEQGAPKDAELNSLGVSFFRSVSANDFNAARSTLAQIETRASEVLAEVLNG